MAATSIQISPEDSGYTRGVRLARVDGGKVARVLIAVSLLGLLILTIALTVSAFRETSRIDALRDRGVPVQATVSSCEGVGASINIGVQYWVCRGDYFLEGNQYNAIIGGSRALLERGQTVQAVAVPGHPSYLSTAESVQNAHSAWAPFLTPLILAGVIILSAGALVLWYLRQRSSHRPTVGSKS